MSASALCSLTCAKLMQTESRAIKFYLRGYAEVQLFLCKVNANREQRHQVLLERLCRGAAFLLQS